MMARVKLVRLRDVEPDDRARAAVSLHGSAHLAEEQGGVRRAVTEGSLAFLIR
jgi:hypothetical protein